MTRPRNERQQPLTAGRIHNGGEITGGVTKDNQRVWIAARLGTSVTVRIPKADAEAFLEGLLAQIRAR